MSLASQLSNFVVRVGTEFKKTNGNIGTLSSLTTTNKASLVQAINELKGAIGAGGSITIDAVTDIATAVKPFLKAATVDDARAAIGAGTSNLVIGTTASTAKAGNYVPAWGDITSKPAVIAAGADAAAARAAIGAGTSSLTLGTTSTTAKAGDYQPTWAQVTSKPAVIAAGTDAAAARTAIGAQSAADVEARITTLINGAPGALDTLGEIAAKLGENDTAVGSIVNSLAKRVAVDSVQSFTAAETLQARNNISVYSKAEIGDPATDFVAAFEAALV